MGSEQKEARDATKWKQSITNDIELGYLQPEDVRDSAFDFLCSLETDLERRAGKKDPENAPTKTREITWGHSK